MMGINGIIVDRISFGGIKELEEMYFDVAQGGFCDPSMQGRLRQSHDRVWLMYASTKDQL
jgi:hypothetical protein